MAPLSAQLLTDNSILNLRDVVLSQSDTPQTFREKLARVILDEMYQFVGVLDANGMTLEINRAALEGAGIQLNDIQGRPFWEARWWQVCSETREKQRELCGAARMTMDYVNIDLSRLVRTVAAHFDALAPQRTISYVIVTPDAVRAEIDAEKLERILLNLLSNAFKFTPPGGRIRCTVAVRNEAFVLAVQGSGLGIPPAMRGKILERFRQAQGGTTREFSGTGLGLSIPRDFVELHGELAFKPRTWSPSSCSRITNRG